MKKEIFVRQDKNLVYYQIDEVGTIFCCTHSEWELKTLRTKILSEFNVPQELLSQFESIVRVVTQHEASWNS